MVVEATPTAEAPTEKPAAAAEYVTKTVYGFLDFTTTVGSTVMIFTPQSQSASRCLHVSFSSAMVLPGSFISGVAQHVVSSNYIGLGLLWLLGISRDWEYVIFVVTVVVLSCWEYYILIFIVD